MRVSDGVRSRFSGCVNRAKAREVKQRPPHGIGRVTTLGRDDRGPDLSSPRISPPRTGRSRRITAPRQSQSFEQIDLPAAVGTSIDPVLAAVAFV
jgi:hypothetical protein